MLRAVCIDIAHKFIYHILTNRTIFASAYLRESSIRTQKMWVRKTEWKKYPGRQ